MAVEIAVVDDLAATLAVCFSGLSTGSCSTMPAKPMPMFDQAELFHIHKNPNPDGLVGRNIHHALGDRLRTIQDGRRLNRAVYAGGHRGRCCRRYVSRS